MKRVELKYIFSKAGSLFKNLIFKNIFWLIFDQFARVLLAIIVGSWTARYLGKSDFGQLSFALSYLTMFQIITGLGLDSVAVRELVTKRDIAAKLLGTIFYLRLTTGIINWVISILMALLIYGLSDDIYIIITIAGASLVFQSFSTIELWFQSNNKSFKIVLPKLVSTFITNSVKIYFIVNKFSIYYFAILFSFEFLLSGCFLYFSYLKYKVTQKWNFDLVNAKVLLIDSWPFLISAVSIYLYTRVDSFIIKKYLGSSELGLYTAAITISSILPMIPMILFNVINPIIAKIKYENEATYNLYLQKAFQLFTYGGIIFSLIIFIFAPLIVNILYGNEYLESAAILRIHVFTNIFIYSGIAQNFWIINENKGKVNLYKTSVGVFCSFVLNIILIPRYGILGAAYSAVIVQLISSVLINLFVAPKIFKLQFTSLFSRF
jgi:O-antigen/teichoic acid export membrane protein